MEMLSSKKNILLTDHYGYNNPGCVESQSIYNNCSGEISPHFPGTGYPDLDIKIQPRNLGAFRKVDFMLFKKKDNNMSTPPEIIATVESDVWGAKYPCVRDESKKRMDIMATMNEGDLVSLSNHHADEGSQVLTIDPKTGLDFGNLPSRVAWDIRRDYKGLYFTGTVIRKYPFKIEITIWSKMPEKTTV